MISLSLTWADSQARSRLSSRWDVWVDRLTLLSLSGWCWLVACSNTLLHSCCVCVYLRVCYVSSQCLHTSYRLRSLTNLRRSIEIQEQKTTMSVCVQEVLPWQLPNLLTPNSIKHQRSAPVALLWRQPRCLGNAHTHILFQGRSKDSERLWNPSDPSMQSDACRRDTQGQLVLSCLFTHTHTHTLFGIL